MPHWLADALGIDRALAKQIADELALMGYAEPIPRKWEIRPPRWKPGSRITSGI